jgi:crossover junction endodeoxyribonuclease RuvC
LQQSSKIILGVDPGTLNMGYSVLQVNGKILKMITMDVVKLSSHKDMYERLQIIHQTMQDIIKEFRPQELAIEAPFFGKNVQSMLKLGRAQGIAIAVAMQSGLPVTEYSPRKIKQSITGNGNADKNQVWKMLQQILSLKSKQSTYDASDALAVAVCHHFQDNTSFEQVNGKAKGWEDFVKKNPGRMI